MIKRFLALLIASALPIMSLSHTLKAEPMIEKDTAVLQALDKVTARVSELEVMTDETVQFGSIFLTVRKCKVSDPLDEPEAVSFLEITERKPREAPKLLFSGWMFASSPALSDLQHPVYDVWVLGCKNTEMTDSSSPEENTPPDS